MDPQDRQAVITSGSSRRGLASWSRRRWLGAAVLLWPGVAMTAWGQAPTMATKDEQAVVDEVQARAKKAKIGAIGQTRSAHFLALGDAPSRFGREALDRICEPLGKDFLAYFRRRGFKVAYPEHRLTVVTLKDDKSFKAYIQDNPPEVVAGQYELDTNQLVMFDLRDTQGSLNEVQKRQNTLAMVHETIHLLCFNTGLLSRETDVPRAISEGLATFGELWVPPRSAKAFGATNAWRLPMLNGSPWIPINELMTKDGLFDDPEKAQVAYVEAWLLVHYLLDQRRTGKFQNYLAGIPKFGAGKDRIAYAQAHLGALKDLDQRVRQHVKTVLRK
jgi:hypothetical protein